MKKLAIIGTVGLPSNYGGFETLAENLVRRMDAEYDITVYCSGKTYPKAERQATYHGAKLVYLPLEANGVKSILYDALSILHALFYADVLLILGVAGAWMLPFVRLFTNKKIIISIDGIEWKRDKWNVLAKNYLFWAEGLAVKYSHIDISDNESIQNYTAMRYGSLSRIIEYGADHASKVAPTPEDYQQYPFLKRPYAFKVARIEPENNIHVIVEAFAALPKYLFVLVGNWENSAYGINLRNQYAEHDNLLLLDPIYDQRQLDVLRSNAFIYIHGHSAGGTNPSLVEAMYLGLPILAYGVSYNRVTTEQKALYFKDAKALQELVMNTSVEQLTAVGQQMETIAKRRYTWDVITGKYERLVEEALTLKNKIPIQAQTKELKSEQLIDMGLGHLEHQQYFYQKR